MAVMDSVKEAQTRGLEQMKTVQEQVISFNERIADYLPKPAEVIDSYFAFMGQMHEANKDFANRLASIWERAEEPAPKAAAKK